MAVDGSLAGIHNHFLGGSPPVPEHRERGGCRVRRLIQARPSGSSVARAVLRQTVMATTGTGSPKISSVLCGRDRALPDPSVHAALSEGF
jgi:hypothetical protein